MPADDDQPSKSSRSRALEATIAATHPFWFLRFAILPVLALFLMNLVLAHGVARIAGEVGGKQVMIEQVYGARPSQLQQPHAYRPPCWCVLSPNATDGDALPTISPRQRVSDWRFQWMAYHLSAMLLQLVVGLLSIAIIARNLPRGWREATLAATLAAGGYWAWDAFCRSALDETTELIFSPTRIWALTRFNQEFQLMAWNGARFDYALGLVVTLLIVVAAVSAMAGLDPPDPLAPPASFAETVARKRSDLRRIIVAASIYMSITGFYVASWVAWPAAFSPPVPGASALSQGLLIYFGTGYSLALLGFAIPAVRHMSTAVRIARIADDKPGEALLDQSVFTKTEVSLLLSVLAPFVTAVLGVAVKV